jgi:hypothetical protein
MPWFLWVAILTTAALGAGLAPSGCARVPRARARPAAPALVAPPGASESDPALAIRGAAQLALALRTEGFQDATPEGDMVRVQGHALGLRVGVDQVIEEGDHTTAAVHVAVAIDGRLAEALRVEAIGIDKDRTEAVEHAIREWGVGYGIPIADALRYLWGRSSSTTARESTASPSPPATETGAAGLTLGAFRVFPGPTGVRGEPPAGWRGGTPTMHRALLARVEGALRDVLPDPGSGLHALKLALHVRDGASDAGDCRVDATPSEALCRAAREGPWPAGPSEFLVKQFYVLVPQAP